MRMLCAAGISCFSNKQILFLRRISIGSSEMICKQLLQIILFSASSYMREYICFRIFYIYIYRIFIVCMCVYTNTYFFLLCCKNGFEVLLHRADVDLLHLDA